MLYFTLNAFYEDSLELWESYSRFMAKENRAMEIRHLIQRPSRANRRSRIAVDRAAKIPSFHPHRSQQERGRSKLHKAKITQEQANLAKLCRVWPVGQKNRWKSGDNDP